MGLNKYQKGDFTSSTVAFYQKLVSNFLNPFTNISGYLDLWHIFWFIFRQLKMTFFHQILIFLQMYKTVLQRVKQLLNVKMVNLEKTQ